ncbi:GIY-YIG nuclease family protein [Verrucomicrobiota bacterium]
MYYAYVLRSEHDGRLYKGSCADIAVRVQRHNSEKVRSTKPFRPFHLYSIRCLYISSWKSDRPFGI